MRLGLLTDIHECDPELRTAIDWMRDQGVDQFVFMGDVVACQEKELDSCIDLLRQLGAVGVWGNHDYELVFRNAATSHSSREFFSSLMPRIKLDDCLVSHVFPTLDPAVDEEIWYLERFPEALEDAVRCFEAHQSRIMLTGHMHHWHAVKDDELLSWDGSSPLDLDPHSRYLFVVGAVCNRKCGILDTESNQVIPYQW